MKSLDHWLNEYAVSHCNPTNQIIHKICVPLIMFSLLGMLWVIPTPETFKLFKYMNWSTIFTLFCLTYYAKLNFKMFLGMIVMMSPMMFGIVYLSENYADLLLKLMVAIFVVSWIGQFIGHKIEGKKPSFFKDLSFLLIGPLWVLKSLYKKLGIN
jgi:uncharacterized membrane protein YGL010W